MKAGSLRHRVVIQSVAETQNDHGETIQTWQDFAECNAAISPLSAREVFSAPQMQADVTHKIKLRFVPGIAPTMRVLLGARVFNITSVINLDERGIELELLSKETV